MRTRFSSPLPPFSLSLCSLPSRVTFVHSMVRAVRHREALGPCEVIPSRFCSGRDVHLLRGAESTTEVRHDADRRSRTSTHLRGLPVALDLPAWGRPRLRCSGCLCPLLHAKSVLPCPAGSSFNFPTDISISIFVTIPFPQQPAQKNC